METTNQINLFYPVLFILIFGISLLYCFFKFKKIDQETQNKTTTTLKLVHKHSLDKPFTVQYTILQEKEMQDIQERLKILEETVKKYIQ